MKKTAPAPDQKKAYQGSLAQRREEILAGMGTQLDRTARNGQVAEDDQAQLSHDEFISLRLNGLDCAQLRLIEEALDRLRSGDYGICLSCEAPIAEKRLQALPWARYCVHCQERSMVELDHELPALAEK
jgi:DnaK suppressor protein